MAEAHCPHCSLPIAGDARLPYPPGPLLCPHCGLMIGPGRALAHAADAVGSAGAAAGRRAAIARDVGADPRDAGALLDAVRRVAARRMPATRTLTMLDYEAATRADPSLPPLAEILATFGRWKEVARLLRGAERATEGS